MLKVQVAYIAFAHRWKSDFVSLKYSKVHICVKVADYYISTNLEKQ